MLWFCVYQQWGFISLMHLKSIRWFYLVRGDLLPSVQNIPLKTMQPLLQAMSHSYMLNMHFFRWTGSTQKWGQWFCLYELCGFVSTNYVVLCLLTMWFCAYQPCGFVFTNYVVLCPLFMSFWNLTFFCILLFPLFQSFLSPLIMWFCVYQLCGFVSTNYVVLWDFYSRISIYSKICSFNTSTPVHTLPTLTMNK